ncbi:nuclear transport factor 2 family protein [Mycobacterium sp. URHB0044]|uniref:nuclear transport factor 2 family protein n=1 Tax=Mycobacterium sp. URHB0044 TaxID=1380386 RepID=UPI00049137F3|nr:nuclear transport factor 2 family protein [Mycobacterium sp. URHB0044]
MPSPEQITQTVNRYLELVAAGSADEIVELYASDATIEDPVGGGEVHIGRQAIHGFYSNIENLKRKSELVTLRVGGHEAAYFWNLTVDFGGSASRIEIISVMTFDDEAKITSMKAYWGPENMTQL